MSNFNRRHQDVVVPLNGRQARPEHASSLPKEDEDVDEHLEFSLLASKPREAFQKIYTLSIHDNATSPGVLLNQSMFPSALARAGSLMQITSMSHESNQLSFNASHGQPSLKPSKSLTNSSYLFFVKFASPELLSKVPSLQISLPQSVAYSLRLSKSIPVLVSTEDEYAKRASHVELIFRDQYLARADMWHLINSQLVGKCVYRGQRVEFMGTIKAMV